MITDKLLLFIQLSCRGLSIFPSLRECVVPRCIYRSPVSACITVARHEASADMEQNWTNLSRLEWMLWTACTSNSSASKRAILLCDQG